MKTFPLIPKPASSGMALLITVILTGVALAILGGVMTWTTTSSRLTYRSNQYGRATAAAEAATEKVLSQVSRDFLSGGLGSVNANLAGYRLLTPTTNDSAYWGEWQFNDAQYNADRTCILYSAATNYVVLNSIYSGLKGYVNTMTIVSDARQNNDYQKVVGGILQQIQLAQIPIFQFVMYSTADMEISCGQPFYITGRTHSNGKLYVEPDNLLTFQSDVTSVSDIKFSRHPLDTRSSPSGSVVYQVPPNSGVTALSLPIGTNNTPAAVREIIQMPPTNEIPTSPIGLLRYYNQADMIITVSNSGVTATSGRFNNFSNSVPTTELTSFVTTTNSFLDVREVKSVQPIDINIGALKSWSATNTTIRPALGGQDVSSVYVVDRRTLAATQLGAVRVNNGPALPSRGLTVATARPLYVKGHYNQNNSAFLGTTNTITTLPASLVGDAITILSPNWTDANSILTMGSRNAVHDTVNAAIIAGSVTTVLGQYSGGMENFPRFLEQWGGGAHFTYNGAMINMFPSLYATNYWGKPQVYAPPARDWAYDRNFEDPTKLPPLTPSVYRVIRGQWATVAPNQTTAP